MAVDRIEAVLEFLISRWSIETHTFVTSWGDFGLSLEDMPMLTSLSLFGEAYASSFYPDGEEKKQIDFLTRSL